MKNNHLLLLGFILFVIFLVMVAISQDQMFDCAARQKPAPRTDLGKAMSAAYAYIPAEGGKIITFNMPITTIATDGKGNIIRACDANGKCYIGN